MAKLLVIYEGDAGDELELVDAAFGDAPGARRLREGVYVVNSLNVNMRRIAQAAERLQSGRLCWASVEDDALHVESASDR